MDIQVVPQAIKTVHTAGCKSCRHPHNSYMNFGADTVCSYVKWLVLKVACPNNIVFSISLLTGLFCTRLANLKLVVKISIKQRFPTFSTSSSLILLDHWQQLPIRAIITEQGCPDPGVGARYSPWQDSSG